VNYSPLEQTDN